MNDPLDVEYAALQDEHAVLEADHERLRANPNDLPGHLAHRKALRTHIQRLHDFVNWSREARRSN